MLRASNAFWAILGSQLSRPRFRFYEAPPPPPTPRNSFGGASQRQNKLLFWHDKASQKYTQKPRERIVQQQRELMRCQARTRSWLVPQWHDVVYCSLRRECSFIKHNEDVFVAMASERAKLNLWTDIRLSWTEKELRLKCVRIPTIFFFWLGMPISVQSKPSWPRIEIDSELYLFPSRNHLPSNWLTISSRTARWRCVPASSTREESKSFRGGICLIAQVTTSTCGVVEGD